MGVAMIACVSNPVIMASVVIWWKDTSFKSFLIQQKKKKILKLEPKQQTCGIKKKSQQKCKSSTKYLRHRFRVET